LELAPVAMSMSGLIGNQDLGLLLLIKSMICSFIFIYNLIRNFRLLYNKFD